jgi:hypothetical protein
MTYVFLSKNTNMIPQHIHIRRESKNNNSNDRVQKF